MKLIDTANAFLAHIPIQGVAFEHNEAVCVVSGEHSGKVGSLVSINSLGHDPSYTLELSSGPDVVVLQSQLRRVGF